MRSLEAVLAAVADGEEDVLNVAAVARRAGVSRQAVYLHFDNRRALGVAAARWLDEREDVHTASAPIGAAPTPEAALDAYAAFLGAYNPRIAPVVRMAYRLRTIPELEEVWQDRLRARRAAAGRIATRLAESRGLAEPFSVESAGDWLAAMGSVLLWEELTKDFGWTTDRYVQHLQVMFRRTLLTA